MKLERADTANQAGVLQHPLSPNPYPKSGIFG